MYFLKGSNSPLLETAESSEAPRAEKGVWAFFEKSDKLIEIDPNGFGLDAVLFWASGTQ